MSRYVLTLVYNRADTLQLYNLLIDTTAVVVEDEINYVSVTL